LSALGYGQSTARKFVDQYKGENARSFFLYKSTLRSFSDKNSESFNKLIENVERISIHLLPDSIPPKSIEELKVNFAKEGFELLKFDKTLDKGFSIYKKSDKNMPEYVAIMNAENNTLLIELLGEVDLKHIASLRELSPQKIAGFFGIEVPK